MELNFGPNLHMVGPTGGGEGIEVRNWTACVGRYMGAAGLLGLFLLGPLAGLLHPGQGLGAPSGAPGQREDLPTPLEVVQRFFDILARTGFTAHFGSIGSKGDYLAAYALLSPRYQAEVPFDRFHESFRGVAALEVLRLVLLPGAGARRLVFVELRTLEEVGPGRLGPDPMRSAFLYYGGLLAVVQEEGGWRIDRLELKAEDFISPRGGHQPWRRDPQAVAAVVAREALEEIGVEDPWTHPCSLEELGSGLVEVVFSTEKGRVAVLLVRLANGNWWALQVLPPG